MFSCPYDFFTSSSFVSQSNVVVDSIIEQDWLLPDVSHITSQPPNVLSSQILVVNPDDAVLILWSLVVGNNFDKLIFPILLCLLAVSYGIVESLKQLNNC